MKKFLFRILFAVLAISSVATVGCSKDDEEGSAGKTSLTIDGKLTSSSITDEFFMGEYTGDNFADKEYDQTLYTYAAQYESKVDLYPLVELEFEFTFFDATTTPKGKELSIKKTNVSRTFDDFSENYYRSVVSGNITFEAYDSANNLMYLRFNDMVIKGKTDSDKITIKGVAVYSLD